MFTKLLAHEIRSRYRADVRSFGAFIVTIAVASGIVAAGLPGISGSTATLAYALCALTPVACAIAAMADYWKTLYGQRGYFTMSLPISGTAIFWAKITRMAIECLLALVLAVGGILAVASAAAWSDGVSLAEYTAGPRSVVAGMPTFTVVIMIVVQVLVSLSWLVQGSAVMSIGAEGRRADHRFRPAVHREPGAFHGWHVLPPAVCYNRRTLLHRDHVDLVPGDDGNRGVPERHRHRLLCPRAPVRSDHGPVGLSLDREAHVPALSA